MFILTQRTPMLVVLKCATWIQSTPPSLKNKTNKKTLKCYCLLYRVSQKLKKKNQTNKQQLLDGRYILKTREILKKISTSKKWFFNYFFKSFLKNVHYFCAFTIMKGWGWLIKAFHRYAYFNRMAYIISVQLWHASSNMQIHKSTVYEGYSISSRPTVEVLYSCNLARVQI